MLELGSGKIHCFRKDDINAKLSAACQARGTILTGSGLIQSKDFLHLRKGQETTLCLNPLKTSASKLLPHVTFDTHTINETNVVCMFVLNPEN